MTTEAQNVKFRRRLETLEASRRTPDKVKMLPRERIRIKRRCRLCGRARAVYRKFGICRICFRNLASDGLVPGVQRPVRIPTVLTGASPLVLQPDAAAGHRPVARRNRVEGR